jgi:hypothetical protein
MAKKPTKYQEEIENAARDFSRDVSWLAGIHVALKSGQKDVIPIATALLVNPERTLGINNYPPNIARIEFENKVALLKRLCSFATALPFNNPGHYLNMSAILHIDALLQGYLDRLFKVACTYKRLHSLPLSAFPSKKKGKEKQADQRSQQGQQKASIRKSEMKAQSVGGKINELFGRLGPKELAGTSIKHAKHAEFIAQLRHIITHNGGFVDIPFLKKSGVNNTEKGIKHWTCTDPLWDTSIWTDLGSFLAAYKPPDSKTSHQGSLAIDTVILPYIGHAVDFIQEVANAFRAV